MHSTGVFSYNLYRTQPNFNHLKKQPLSKPQSSRSKKPQYKNPSHIASTSLSNRLGDNSIGIEIMSEDIGGYKLQKSPIFKSLNTLSGVNNNHKTMKRKKIGQRSDSDNSYN